VINLFLIFAYFLIGIGFKKLKWMPIHLSHYLNQFVIYFALPSLIFYNLPGLKLDIHLIRFLLMPWAHFILSIIFFELIGRWRGWDKKLIGCLSITAGLGNTSFVGFPIIEALYGSEGIKYALVIDQGGSFPIVSTLGIIAASYYSSSTDSDHLVSSIFKKILLFPPFVASVIALFLLFNQINFPSSVSIIFKILSMCLTPAALISVGLRLRLDQILDEIRYLSVGLGFKLILVPLFVVLTFSELDIDSLGRQVLIMEAAMAPMITGTILATNYGLRPRLASAMIGLGIPLSFITLTFWYFLIS
jgi:hypothetical protein